MWSDPATRATASSGTATMISSTSSMRAVASAKARLPSTRLVNRSRRSASRLATAFTGHPARRSATPERGPDGARADDPDDRRLVALGPDVGVGVVARVDLAAVAVVAGRDRVEVDAGCLELLDGLAARRILRGAVVAGSRARAVLAIPAPGLHRPADRASGLARYSSTRRVYRPRRRGRVPSQDLRTDPFDARASLGEGLPDYFRLSAVADRLDLGRAPVTLKILVENVLRHAGHGIVRGEEVETLASWRAGQAAEAEVPFMPARVILQDFTGRAGRRRPRGHARRDGRPRRRPGDRQPARARPTSSSTTRSRSTGSGRRRRSPSTSSASTSGTASATSSCAGRQTAFRDLRVVRPGPGIVHQVNLEYLATVVTDAPDRGGRADRLARTRSSGPTRTRR
jgi:hypothetical protein